MKSRNSHELLIIKVATVRRYLWDNLTKFGGLTKEFGGPPGGRPQNITLPWFLPLMIMVVLLLPTRLSTDAHDLLFCTGTMISIHRCIYDLFVTKCKKILLKPRFLFYSRRRVSWWKKLKIWKQN